MFRKYVALFLSLLLMIPALAACDGITGGDPESTTTGGQSTDDRTTDGQTTDGSGSGEALTLISDGKPLYTVIRPDDGTNNPLEVEAAVALSAAFHDACGKYIGIKTDWKGNEVSDYEICIGNLTRNGSAYNADISGLGNDQFSVKVYGKRIVILAPNSYGTLKGTEWFAAEYLTVTDGSMKELTVPGNLDHTGSFDLPTGIKVMTQNLLATDDEYKNFVAGGLEISVKLEDNTIAKRQPRVLSLIKKYMPDSLGVQECSAPWRQYLDNNLGKLGYKRIGAPKNQKIGIIYNTKMLKPVATGSFWLTEDPETLKISKEWGKDSDGLTERLGMYVVFEVVATGEKYVHFNTHLDTAKNSVIQTKQTEVLLNYIEKVTKEYGNIPAVLTGDFNYNMDSPAYGTLTGGVLGDAKKLALKSKGAGSFNKFKGEDYASKPIDQMVVSKEGLMVESYNVIYDRFDGNNFASDHYAVIISIGILK